jgi:ABC-type dipeptide/oligopeptide/nickel transport system ATPase component
MAKVIDWYKKIPKRFLLDSHNPHYEQHHIKLPCRMLIIGSSGSGKTQTLLSLIYNMPDTFENIYITTKNADEPLYNFLGEKLKEDNLKITEGIENLPDLDKLDKTTQTLIVMDDLVNEKNQKQICDYFIRARKKNASLIYISQSYYAVPKMIRNNLTYLLIKQVSSMKNLVMISREYDLGMEKKQLTAMYNDATKDRQNFLLIDIDAPKPEKYRKGFNDYYEIEGDDEG